MHDGQDVYLEWRIDDIAKPMIAAGELELAGATHEEASLARRTGDMLRFLLPGTELS